MENEIDFEILNELHFSLRPNQHSLDVSRIQKIILNLHTNGNIHFKSIPQLFLQTNNFKMVSNRLLSKKTQRKGTLAIFQRDEGKEMVSAIVFRLTPFTLVLILARIPDQGPSELRQRGQTLLEFDKNW